MLGPDDGDLGEESVADPTFDLFDLLDGLLLGETVQEQIDVGSRAELLMVELAEATLGTVVLLRNGKQGVDHRRS
jgi:hypothetical protein